MVPAETGRPDGSSEVRGGGCEHQERCKHDSLRIRVLDF